MSINRRLQEFSAASAPQFPYPLILLHSLVHKAAFPPSERQTHVLEYDRGPLAKRVERSPWNLTVSGSRPMLDNSADELDSLDDLACALNRLIVELVLCIGKRPSSLFTANEKDKDPYGVIRPLGTIRSI